MFCGHDEKTTDVVEFLIYYNLEWSDFPRDSVHTYTPTHNLLICRISTAYIP